MKNFDCIYNQDCITGMKKIPSDSIDMVITSPPYDNLRDYNNSSIWNFDIFKQVAVAALVLHPVVVEPKEWEVVVELV